MSAEVTAAVVGGVAGVLAGGISSLAAPWSQWGVEQRRARRSERVALVALWREELAKLLRAIDTPGRQDNLPEDEYQDTAWFMTLRPHLLDPTADPWTLTKEIERIEHQWKLQ
jgi:hypothetical protein